MSEAPADATEIDQAGPRRLRPKHLAQLIAMAAVVGLLGLLVWRVARGEAGSGFVAAIREGYSAYGLTGVPETYYLDRRGRAVFHSIGAVSKDDLEVGIRAALMGKS